MGQGDVLKFLEKPKNKHKWWKTKEISESIGVNTGNVGASCRKLYEQGFIDKKYTVFRPKYRLNPTFCQPVFWRAKRSKLLSLL